MGAATEHTGQALPQHLPPLLERRIDQGEHPRPQPLVSRGSCRSNATSTLSTFGTGQNTCRLTSPAVLHEPYQAALTLGDP